MKFEKFWAALVHTFTALLQSSPEDTLGVTQKPIGHPHSIVYKNNKTFPITDKIYPEDIKDDGRAYFMVDNGGPVIPGPKNPQSGEPLLCKYPRMNEWENCHGPNSRRCWLKKKGVDNVFMDIDTNYENEEDIPIGEIRRFEFTASDMTISPDGVERKHAKVFDGQFPGPWIEACWGDWIEVTIINNLRWNGTSVHWHGIRQFHTSHHDGVNGVTECPIAPLDRYTYKFRAMQYGSAWYHSHYSLQYGDGLLGPLTIYGPSTANYDDDQAFQPILMTDWNHRSVFEDWPIMMQTRAAPEMTNILLNGKGQFGPHKKTASKYQLTFTAGKRHMLILINTATDTTFVFSIDNHKLEVISMDFVHIKPYTVDYILVGIGQRYHVIVHGPANPTAVERNGNFWMRTIPARKCSKFAFGPDTDMGIVRYNPNADPDQSPLSDPYLIDTTCRDEPMSRLKPWQRWTVGNPTNINPAWSNEDLKNPDVVPIHKRYIFDVHLMMSGGPENPNDPYIPDDKKYNRWSMHEKPLRIDFDDPLILHSQDADELLDRSWLAVVTPPEIHQHEEKWIWLVVTAQDKLPTDFRRTFIPAAHPMHLHGHDFALLAQSSWPWYNDGDRVGSGEHDLIAANLNCDNPRINCNNPPRRDVVLLPAGGYIVIAFKVDNPGAWIFHCHIAFHASSGLGINILENPHLIRQDLQQSLPAIEQRCRNWRTWKADRLHHWNWQHPQEFQDDSGV